MAGPHLHIRIDLAPGIQLGPGKADLLRAVEKMGSIRKAGESLGMSVKKTAALVEDLNSAFADPLIEATRGGTGGGGAVLTPFGSQVLETYDAIRRDAEKASSAQISSLTTKLAKRRGRRS